VNLAFRDVLPAPVSDRLVLGIVVGYALVRVPLVGVNRLRVPHRALAYEAVQGFSVRFSHDLKADVPAPLHGTHPDDLVVPVATTLPTHRS